jgi:hypothetical protein
VVIRGELLRGWTGTRVGRARRACDGLMWERVAGVNRARGGLPGKEKPAREVQGRLLSFH